MDPVPNSENRPALSVRDAERTANNNQQFSIVEEQINRQRFFQSVEEQSTCFRAYHQENGDKQQFDDGLSLLRNLYENRLKALWLGYETRYFPVTLCLMSICLTVSKMHNDNEDWRNSFSNITV